MTDLYENSKKIIYYEEKQEDGKERAMVSAVNVQLTVMNVIVEPRLDTIRL